MTEVIGIALPGGGLVKPLTRKKTDIATKISTIAPHTSATAMAVGIMDMAISVAVNGAVTVVHRAGHTEAKEAGMCPLTKLKINFNLEEVRTCFV